MRILVGWNDVAQGDLIQLILSAGDHDVVLCTNWERFDAEVQGSDAWDIVLMAIGEGPGEESSDRESETDAAEDEVSYDRFCNVRNTLPGVPIVGACSGDNVYRIARYMTNGMRMYLIRDSSGDFIFMMQSILESTVQSVRAEREQFIAEKLREEIESVRKLQESIIPQDLDCPDGFDISARYESSQIRVMGGQPVTLAGGDYYDVFRLDDDSLVVLVGDASGHGMKACMSIMTMHTLVSMIRTHAYEDTAKFVADVNRRLCEHSVVSGEGGFITLLYGILRTDTNEFQWTSAGHPIPMLQDLADGSVEPLGTLEDGGLPLGVVEDAEYDVHTSIIPPGSRLLVYTDGLEEAFPYGNRDHDQYGIEGIVRTMQTTRDQSTKAALQALFDESTAYTLGAGRHDDTSVVLVERAEA